ncbi:hypothetical protein MtrunA17_Chr5g0423941 [Medicago truncatula]|uniref:Transmembrane protein n=1 Tax=Medicago truncatula TaxID=3880 RepID=A0A396HVF4_MEDTR|nr:hypothetical protein MtrunA17_Chr5g0423941 [Medicago truncatula]
MAVRIVVSVCLAVECFSCWAPFFLAASVFVYIELEMSKIFVAWRGDITACF